MLSILHKTQFIIIDLHEPVQEAAHPLKKISLIKYYIFYYFVARIHSELLHEVQSTLVPSNVHEVQLV